MRFLYKNYGSDYPGATLISVLGGVFGILAVLSLVAIIKDSFQQPVYLIAVAIGIAGYIGFRKLADIVYNRKVRKAENNSKEE